MKEKILDFRDDHPMIATVIVVTALVVGVGLLGWGLFVILTGGYGKQIYFASMGALVLFALYIVASIVKSEIEERRDRRIRRRNFDKYWNELDRQFGLRKSNDNRSRF